MKTTILSTVLSMAWVGFSPAAEETAPPDESLKPGLVYVFFDDAGFQRPGSHGIEAGVKDHGVVTAVDSYTIVRPGRLTNEPGLGRVSLAAKLPGPKFPGLTWPPCWPTSLMRHRRQAISST